MDPGQFLHASRVVIVAGKGGVGKTTVAAALARMAAREGLSTLVVQVEPSSGMARLFGRPPLGYAESSLAPAAGTVAEIRGRTITPDDALLEYLEDHGLRRISRRLVSTGAMDVVATAAPGIKDILILGKVKALERSGSADLIVLDAPAAGHAITFLLSVRGLLDAVRVGPVNAQARDVLELLTDPARCSVMLVTLPEETPVNELVETAFTLEDRVGVALGPVVVNGLYSALPGMDASPVEAAAEVGATLRAGEAGALAEAAGFRRRRRALQEDQLARLDEMLPMPQLHLPFLFSADLGPTHVDTLAGALRDGVTGLADPTASTSSTSPP
ncbi:MAG TPA: ArsA-related P-loop ATPase [Acidimicrobiales bacterium]|nr:ArsA-related P-loop ATPase [Acidimicrobiales bacterium]